MREGERTAIDGREHVITEQDIDAVIAGARMPIPFCREGRQVGIIERIEREKIDGQICAVGHGVETGYGEPTSARVAPADAANVATAARDGHARYRIDAGKRP